jgi:hypothetical protein
MEGTIFLLECLKEDICRKRKRVWDDNIKIGLREVSFGRMDWIYLGNDRSQRRTPMNIVMNLGVG